MRQMILKFNIVRNASIVHNDIERIAFRFIVWSFGALALLYVIFLGNMVKDVIERRSLETRAHIIANEVGNLELTYLSLSNNIDLNLSYSLGFKETQVIFAPRKSLGLGLTGELGNVNTAQNDL